MKRLFAAVTLALLLGACGNGGDGAGDAPDPTATLDTPTAVAPPATDTPVPPPVAMPNTAPAAEIELPEGFTAYPIANGMFRPTSIAIDSDGAIFVALRHNGILRWRDLDGDGVFEDNTLFSPGFDETTGIALGPDGALYVSSPTRITVWRDIDGDGVADENTEIVGGLETGRHHSNGLAFGPDGKLYITNGSTCDECFEDDPRSASILQANPDGSDLQIYATGLRNPYDIAFDAQGRLWSTDNGSDTPCETIDELNLIEAGGDYGWPYGIDGCDPYQDGIPPVASLGLHTASTGVVAYDAAHFPQPYRGNLFATVWGSQFAQPDPYDRVLLRVALLEDALGGQPSGFVEEFGAGFEHPIDVLVDVDGTLLVLDYGGDGEDESTGRLYRIVYSGE